MPASFSVNAASCAYSVSIGLGLLTESLMSKDDRIVIADAYFAPQVRAAGLDVIAFTANEAAKSLHRIPEVISELRRLGVSRKTTLLAVGGGAVQDIGGFVASIYNRGVSWIYVPTTLLGMADSCIGGKSSINVGPYKNIVGTFFPPVAVNIDPSLCQTLSVEQRVAGLCEAAKICFCRDRLTFEAYLAMHPKIEASVEEFSRVVELSLLTKKWFVEIDEFDRAERLSLNFGHTFGHAIEAASQFRISHGVAVGLGILAANRFGAGLGRTYGPDSPAYRLACHIEALVILVPGVRKIVKALPLPALMDAFASDKKHDKRTFSVIVAKEDGGVEKLTLDRNESVSRFVSATFADLIQRLGT